MFAKFNVIKNSKLTLIITAVILVLCIASMLVIGFNIDIDFSGGTEIRIDIDRNATNEDCNAINQIIEDNLGHEYVSSTTKDLRDTSLIIIRTGTAALTTEQSTALLEKLSEKFGKDFSTEKDNMRTITATVGKQLTKTAVLSVLIAVAAMLVYIAFRFRSVDSALAAIVCLAFNVIVMVGVYSVFGIPVDSNIIAAILTILGYSINSTIVIFDRIREDKKLYGVDKTFGEVVTMGTSETMGRSINTTLTTLFTIGMIYILGVASIRDFALPIIIGIVAGLFSSVCLSGCIWVTFDKWFAPLKVKFARKNKKSKA